MCQLLVKLKCAELLQLYPLCSKWLYISAWAAQVPALQCKPSLMTQHFASNIIKQFGMPHIMGCSKAANLQPEWEADCLIAVGMQQNFHHTVYMLHGNMLLHLLQLM